MIETPKHLNHIHHLDIRFPLGAALALSVVLAFVLILHLP